MSFVMNLRYQQLETQVAQLREESKRLRERGGTLASDPLGELYAFLSCGVISAKDVSFWLVFTVAIMGELLGAFGFLEIAHLGHSPAVAVALFHPEMVMRKAHDLRQMGYAKDLTPFSQLSQFLAHHLGGATSDARIDFIEHQRARSWQLRLCASGTLFHADLERQRQGRAWRLQLQHLRERRRPHKYARGSDHRIAAM